MLLDAMVYGLPSGSRPVFRQVEFSEDNFKLLAEMETPAVFVLREEDVKVNEELCDWGTQHAGKELASILIGRKPFEGKDNPFVLISKYKSPGTLNNAVQKFLDRVVESAEKKNYFICVGSQLFQKLAGNDAVKGVSQRKGSGTHRRKQTLAMTEPLFKEELIAKNILDLMANDRELQDDSIVRNRFRGSSYSCQLVRQRILQAAHSNSTVMIEGERGTGKEEVAKAIHDLSPLKNGPFIAINCSAISEKLLEAELFGMVKDYPNKGTPAKLGLWSAAENGTLFLDEIGELNSDHQAKILRALQEKDIQPVGATRFVPVNARVIAATNSNLYSRHTPSGQLFFRQDLYSRLKSLIIRTPPLRSHLEDLPELAQHLWREVTEGKPDALKSDVIDLLMEQNWDDNVRGLRNILEDLNCSFPSNPTAEKLELLLQYRNAVTEQKITRENLVTPELSDMIELLASVSHSTWFKKREQEGWVLGEKRVETADLKTNPDMKPYFELSEAQKSYARDEARAIIKAILDEGYTIIK